MTTLKTFPVKAVLMATLTKNGYQTVALVARSLNMVIMAHL